MATGRVWAAVLALTLMMGCGGVEEQSELAGLLPPASELDGWVASEGPIEHSPETLYEYLDGGADRYLTSGFRELLHVRYQLGDDPLACVTLDVYNMGTELGAFGIYSAARPPGVELRRWGAEGYREGTIAAARKGRVYVHGEADDEQPELIRMLERLVAWVSDGAAGEASPPSILAPLPVAGRVPQSERYLPANLLGHSFLPGGVLASYEIEGQGAELYFSELAGETAAGEALGALRDHLAQWGSIDDEVSSIGAGGFRYTEPTLGAGTVVRAGSHVAGIHGDLPAEARERVLGELVANMP